MQLTYIPGMRHESEELLPTQYTMPSYGTDVDMAVVKTKEDPLDLENSLGDFYALPMDVLKLILEQTKHPEKMALRLTSRAFQHLIDETPLPLTPEEKQRRNIYFYNDFISKSNQAVEKKSCFDKYNKGWFCITATTVSGCGVSALTACIGACVKSNAIFAGGCIGVGTCFGAACLFSCCGIWTFESCWRVRILNDVEECEQLRSSIREH